MNQNDAAESTRKPHAWIWAVMILAVAAVGGMYIFQRSGTTLLSGEYSVRKPYQSGATSPDVAWISFFGNALTKDSDITYLEIRADGTVIYLEQDIDSSNFSSHEAKLSDPTALRVREGKISENEVGRVLQDMNSLVSRKQALIPQAHATVVSGISVDAYYRKNGKIRSLNSMNLSGPEDVPNSLFQLQNLIRENPNQFPYKTGVRAVVSAYEQTKRMQEEVFTSWSGSYPRAIFKENAALAINALRETLGHDQRLYYVTDQGEAQKLFSIAKQVEKDSKRSVGAYPTSRLHLWLSDKQKYFSVSLTEVMPTCQPRLFKFLANNPTSVQLKPPYNQKNGDPIDLRSQPAVYGDRINSLPYEKVELLDDRSIRVHYANYPVPRYGREEWQCVNRATASSN